MNTTNTTNTTNTINLFNIKTVYELNQEEMKKRLFERLTEMGFNPVEVCTLLKESSSIIAGSFLLFDVKPFFNDGSHNGSHKLDIYQSMQSSLKLSNTMHRFFNGHQEYLVDATTFVGYENNVLSKSIDVFQFRKGTHVYLHKYECAPTELNSIAFADQCIDICEIAFDGDKFHTNMCKEFYMKQCTMKFFTNFHLSNISAEPREVFLNNI